MTNTDWQSKITRELRLAHQARVAGNEGKARVCARRAAGWAIKQHLLAQGVELTTPSAFQYIQYMRAQPDNPPRLSQVLDHLVARVEKDSLEADSYWPLDADLIAEARWLAEELLGVELPLDN